MIHETLGEDLQEFGRGFARIQETLGEHSQGFPERSHNLDRSFRIFI